MPVAPERVVQQLEEVIGDRLRRYRAPQPGSCRDTDQQQLTRR
jgi:hypothetical protein